MVYHAFMSHCQREAAGDVGKVYELYVKRGLHNWLDMKQAASHYISSAMNLLVCCSRS